MFAKKFPGLEFNPAESKLGWIHFISRKIRNKATEKLPGK